MIKLAPAAHPASSPTLVAIALVAVAGALTLGGCGKKKPAPATPPAAATGSASPTPTPTPTPTPPTPTPTPIPAAGPASVTGVVTCDQFLAVLDHAIACPQLASARSALQANLANQKSRFAGWAALSAADRTAAMAEASTQCQGGIDGVKSTMASAGCAP